MTMTALPTRKRWRLRNVEMDDSDSNNDNDNDNEKVEYKETVVKGTHTIVRHWRRVILIPDPRRGLNNGGHGCQQFGALVDQFGEGGESTGDDPRPMRRAHEEREIDEKRGFEGPTLVLSKTRQSRFCARSGQGSRRIQMCLVVSYLTLFCQYMSDGCDECCGFTVSGARGRGPLRRLISRYTKYPDE